jgi:Sec-independent protein translocase protein TatA
MMGIGLSEGVILLLIAALFLKGEEIATVARTLGRWLGQAQRMSRTFMEELQREVDVSDIKESVKEVRGLMDVKEAQGGKPLERLLGDLEGPEGAKEDPEGPPPADQDDPAG